MDLLNPLKKQITPPVGLKAGRKDSNMNAKQIIIKALKAIQADGNPRTIENHGRDGFKILLTEEGDWDCDLFYCHLTADDARDLIDQCTFGQDDEFILPKTFEGKAEEIVDKLWQYRR